ncbi:nitroreductase family protein [Anaerotignum sp.]
MNETLTVIKERSSCKMFTDVLPEKEKLQAIAEAAIQSPSAMNAQPWQIIVISDKKLIEELETETIHKMGQTPAFKSFYDMVTSTGMKLFYNAPCMIVLPIEKNNIYSKYDCGIASQTIALAAQSLGIASRIIAIADVAFSGEKKAYFKEKFQFPEGYEFGLAILLGYAEKPNAPHEPKPEKITYID